MKQQYIIALLIVIVLSEAQVNEIPKLPLFIGKGYDILAGNPLSSEGVDPGFQHEIFEFSYSNNETT